MMPSASASVLQHHRRIMRAAWQGMRPAPRVATSSFHTSRPVAAMNPSFEGAESSSSDSNSKGGYAALLRYSEQHSTPQPEKFATLHASSVEHYPSSADKTISAMQGNFLTLLMRMTRPQVVLELGCFMGYSAMAMADGMPQDSVLYTCELDSRAAQLARDLFEREGYNDQGISQNRQLAKIELLEGDGLASLQTLTKAKSNLKFDAVFIDADKGNYINYYNFIMDNDLLSDHGYILVDNALFQGLVVHSPSQDDQTKKKGSLPSPPPSPRLDASSSDAEKQKTAVRYQKYANHVDAFNRQVAKDPRVDVVLLPVFDGLSVIMKKSEKKATRS
ncbi:hypothetical protein BGZ70_010204 [Mortierella alpina]|uniref:O-methyltransferase n=1 Tax=Mortierella alpina TaxID=64518 RepID=A0A9P6JET8_MORAP|nr:hypothetical protein BGZ70_010204 [Mortierella alpina]